MSKVLKHLSLNDTGNIIDIFQLQQHDIKFTIGNYYGVFDCGFWRYFKYISENEFEDLKGNRYQIKEKEVYLPSNTFKEKEMYAPPEIFYNIYECGYEKACIGDFWIRSNIEFSEDKMKLMQDPYFKIKEFLKTTSLNNDEKKHLFDLIREVKDYL